MVSPTPKKTFFHILNWVITLAARTPLTNMLFLSFLNLFPILSFSLHNRILRNEGFLRELEWSAFSNTLWIKNWARWCFNSSGSSLSIFVYPFLVTKLIFYETAEQIRRDNDGSSLWVAWFMHLYNRKW